MVSKSHNNTWKNGISGSSDCRHCLHMQNWLNNSCCAKPTDLRDILLKKKSQQIFTDELTHSADLTNQLVLLH